MGEEWKAPDRLEFHQWPDAGPGQLKMTPSHHNPPNGHPTLEYLLATPARLAAEEMREALAQCVRTIRKECWEADPEAPIPECVTRAEAALGAAGWWQTPTPLTKMTPELLATAPPGFGVMVDENGESVWDGEKLRPASGTSAVDAQNEAALSRAEEMREALKKIEKEANDADSYSEGWGYAEIRDIARAALSKAEKTDG